MPFPLRIKQFVLFIKLYKKSEKNSADTLELEASYTKSGGKGGDVSQVKCVVEGKKRREKRGGGRKEERERWSPHWTKNFAPFRFQTAENERERERYTQFHVFQLPFTGAQSGRRVRCSSTT